MKIRTVTVLGANGTMGRNVAGLFASFGDAKVYVVSRRKEDSEAALEGAAKSVRAGVITRNLIPMDYSSLETCVRESDLVFESVAENLAAKIDVWERVATSLVPGTLACTGTSGLSIDRLASVLPQSCRPFFTGMHFFNPPYAMRLCELCPFADMSEATEAEVKSYLNGVLHRVVVRVGDTPAFLGNKIGFEFINRAMQLAEKYSDRGGIDYVDSILGPFTGRAMAPLNTADFVGLDVHKAIVDNVYSNEPSCPMHDAFSLPAFCTHLVSRGRLGRKTGGGSTRSSNLRAGTRGNLFTMCRKMSSVQSMSTAFPLRGTWSLPSGSETIKAQRTSCFRMIVRRRASHSPQSVNTLRSRFSRQSGLADAYMPPTMSWRLGSTGAHRLLWPSSSLPRET